MPKDLNKDFERKHLKNILKTQRELQQYFYEVIDEVIYLGVKIKLKSGKFILAKYPALNKEISRILARFRDRVSISLINGIDRAWELSEEKHSEILESRFPLMSDKLKKIVTEPNRKALEAFKKRKVNGLGLSDRVWDLSEQLKDQLETTIEHGIKEGIPAKELASKSKQFLNEPNKLFRRVRNTKGELVESNPMKAYKPGQGVYKSSYKNALRMARTETNMAYRSSDHEAWKGDPLVKGIEVKLSDAHPKYDICDSLDGVYPPGFKFVGWHPQCLCFQVPVLVNDKEFNAIEDAILAGEPAPKIKRINEIPAKAKEYISKNKDRINGLKNTPYFIKDNMKLVGDLIK